MSAPEHAALWSVLTQLTASIDGLRRKNGAGPVHHDWPELRPAPATDRAGLELAALIAEASIPPEKRDHGPIEQHDLVIHRTDYRLGLTLTGSPDGRARVDNRVVVDWESGPELRSIIECWRIQSLLDWIGDEMDTVYRDMNWAADGPGSLSHFIAEHHPDLLQIAKGTS